MQVFKSSNVIVLRNNSKAVLKLIHYDAKKTQHLDMPHASKWLTWEYDRNIAHKCCNVERLLVKEGFAIRCAVPEQLKKTAFDHIIPMIGGCHVKWYAESPDLCILFNTQPMSQNNPLLVLSPYGSLCWHGIIRGWSIGQIRIEALRIFGADEVIPFLIRLIDLEFVRGIPEIDGIRTRPEMLRKEFAAPDVQFQLKHSIIPWYCLWEICTTCNLRCKTCYLPHFEGQGPDAKNTLHIIKQIVDSGIFYVSIMGGEPLLRQDLEKIVYRLRSSGVFVKLISNGLGLTLSRAKSLVVSGLNQIEISFDGLCANTNDISRGVSIFERALEAVNNAKQANIPRVGVIWTVHSNNITELYKLPKFLIENDVKECYISLFKKTGLHGTSAPFNPIRAKDVETIRQQLTPWKKSFPQLEIVLIPDCTCGRTSIVIGENGDVRLCPFSYQKVGNVYEAPLLDIWNNYETNLPEKGPLGFCVEGEQAL